MYEFDEERWDEQNGWDQSGGDDWAAPDSLAWSGDDWKWVQGGWLIQRLDACFVGDQLVAERQATGAHFLQIGTGQWCAAAYATVFPTRSSAEIYAVEYGYALDRHVRVIHRRF